MYTLQIALESTVQLPAVDSRGECHVLNCIADISDLHNILKPFLLRRTKSEVVTDIPSKTEVILYHGLSALQKRFYKAILTKDLGMYYSSDETF